MIWSLSQQQERNEARLPSIACHQVALAKEGATRVNQQMKNMRNEPNFKNTKINLNPVKRMNYEKNQPFTHSQNEPNLRPIRYRYAVMASSSASFYLLQPQFASDESRATSDELPIAAFGQNSIPFPSHACPERGEAESKGIKICKTNPILKTPKLT